MNSETVIMNASFSNSEVHRLLSKLFKIREVETTITHSLIFPKQSKAFLIQPIMEICKVWPPRGKFFVDELIMERINNFQKIHRNAYVFLTAVSITADEELVIDCVQMKFFKEKVVFLPCRGAAQCINLLVDIIRPKLDMSQHVDHAKRLAAGHLEESALVDFLERKFQLEKHDAMVLQDGLGTLANIVNASVEELRDCSLSFEAANKIHELVNSAQ